MNAKPDNPITRGNEALVIIKLAGPMAVSMLGVMVFNLVDTFFVGRLGTIELAALSFTFPVVWVIGSITHGLGVGLTAAVSRAVGQNDRQKQVRLITWGIVLSVIAVSLFAFLGFWTIEVLFTLQGADREALTIIAAYMRIWYPGALVLVLSMAAVAVLYGLGDARTPAKALLAASVINGVLDPLLIFGIGPFPALGAAGAALATVISRGMMLFLLMQVLIFREKTISWERPRCGVVWDAWKEILIVGIPNISMKLIAPIASGLSTRLVAAYGSVAVAGFGIATRIEFLALVVAMPVFIGQNRGAGAPGRVLRGLCLANRFSIVYGLVLFLLLHGVATPVAGLLIADPEVVRVAATYLKIVSLAYGFMGLMQIAAVALSVLNQRALSAGIGLVQTFLIYLPLAWTASACFGLVGIFGALGVSYAMAGIVARRLALKFAAA